MEAEVGCHASVREIEVVHAQAIPIWHREIPCLVRILILCQILAFVPLSVGDAVEELLGLLLLFLRKACAQRGVRQWMGEKGGGEQGTELREEECGVARGEKRVVLKVLKDTVRIPGGETN